MGKIIRIKGNVKQESASGVLLLADEQCIFGIDDLCDETNKGTLTWILKDEKGGKIFNKNGKWNDKLFLTLNKKSSGDYRYQLGAYYVDSKSKKTTYPGIFIGGYCEPKITKAQSDLPQKMGYGIIKGKVTIESEGLNGNSLVLDAEFANTSLNIKPVKCVEGKAIFDISIDTFRFIAEILNTKKDVTKSLKVKVKDSSGNYVKDTSGKEVIIEQNITISPFYFVGTTFPVNNTILSINQPNKIQMAVNGIVELTKVKVNTTYNICNDEIKNYTDYKNLWILNDGTDYYHWLKIRNKPEDVYKPLFLPLTLHSKQLFRFDATFKVLLPIDWSKMKIRVNERDKGRKDKYQIIISSNGITGKKNKGDEVVVSFTSNKPYENTIQYLKDYPLLFEYSLDGSPWIPLANIKFCIYITENAPLWDDYDTITSISGKVYPLRTTPETSLKVMYSGKKYIPESLLHISCQTKLVNPTSDQVIDSIFKTIATRQVKRARNNTEDLGYWRCSSALDPSMFTPRTEKFTQATRSVRFMLRVGDGRCGEWAQFFTALCQTQGISNVNQLAFEFSSPQYTSDKRYISNVFLVKPWLISDPHRPVDQGGQAQGNTRPLNVFSDHVFCVYKGKFYDPSYGLNGSIVHPTWQSVLKEYCPMALQSIPFSIVDNVNGEEFYDNIHTKKYIDPRISAYRYYPNKASVPKLKYINSTNKMESYFKNSY